MSLLTKSGIRNLSELAIDCDKDWLTHSIKNIGAPPADKDVLARGLVNIYGCDYGLNWADLGGIATEEIYAMAYLGNGIAILGDKARHVYRSTDYGVTWVDLGIIATEEIYAMAYLGNGIAILGDWNGHVWRSTNYGATWADLGVIASAIRSMAYLGNGIVILGDSIRHIFRSTSAFQIWER
jgi:photosystem II stability/assembly factor-like uncharacterized protein